MEERLAGIRACVFNAYGTLFDFNSAVARHHGELGEKAHALSAVWRDKQLQYTWLRSLMDRYEDFLHVTRNALDFAMAAVGYALKNRLTHKDFADFIASTRGTVTATLNRFVKEGLLSKSGKYWVVNDLERLKEICW